MSLENRNVHGRNETEMSGNPVRYFYVEFLILIKQFANLIRLFCFSKKPLTNQHRLKGEFVASLNITSYEVALKFFLSHFNLNDYLCVCVFYIF